MEILGDTGLSPAVLRIAIKDKADGFGFFRIRLHRPFVDTVIAEYEIRDNAFLLAQVLGKLDTGGHLLAFALRQRCEQVQNNGVNIRSAQIDIVDVNAEFVKFRHDIDEVFDITEQAADIFDINAVELVGSRVPQHFVQCLSVLHFRSRLSVVAVNAGERVAPLLNKGLKK